ncbi:hypothetical protein QE152_g10863 [Popillia japonica]|uniref:Uncharacterized protein n=1 Tax=Popillia japonica TaxID=7064 RepID=A0AAW1LPC1_POPJA
MQKYDRTRHMRKKHITALVEKTSSSKYVEQRLRRLLQGYVKVYGERICGGSAKKISHGRAAPRLLVMEEQPRGCGVQIAPLYRRCLTFNAFR